MMDFVFAFFTKCILCQGPLVFCPEALFQCLQILFASVLYSETFATFRTHSRRSQNTCTFSPSLAGPFPPPGPALPDPTLPPSTLHPAPAQPAQPPIPALLLHPSSVPQGSHATKHALNSPSHDVLRPSLSPSFFAQTPLFLCSSFAQIPFFLCPDLLFLCPDPPLSLPRPPGPLSLPRPSPPSHLGCVALLFERSGTPTSFIITPPSSLSSTNSSTRLLYFVPRSPHRSRPKLPNPRSPRWRKEAQSHRLSQRFLLLTFPVIHTAQNAHEYESTALDHSPLAAYTPSLIQFTSELLLHQHHLFQSRYHWACHDDAGRGWLPPS